MAVDPQKHRILLVGPRVVHLKPFFERRRYNCVAVQKGVEGMTALDAEPRDIVILELNLGDLTATEFLMAARQAHAQASFLLLDDASKAGQIVKALQAGLDGYLPTPPDEDRLFFEVERHLRNGGGSGGNGNGNGMTSTGETELTERPAEITGLQTQLADRESQLVELGMQNDLLQQEIAKAREQAKMFSNVKQVLVGVLDADLDEDQAQRLKERLSMASVLETEVDALREELGGAKSARRDLQESFDAVKKRVQELEGRLDQKNIDSLEGAALKDRFTELETDNMVLEGRLAELEEELDLAKAEVVALEQKHKADVGDLQRELNRVASDNALSAGDSARLQKEHTSELTRIRQEHEAELARLKEAHEAALKNAVSDVEIERAMLKQKIAEAVAKREKEMASGAQQTATQLQQQLLAAVAEKDQAVEKALDIELLLDELKTKIEFLEGEVVKAQDRAKNAEDTFKRDKLRLIEEKEVAASGSSEAFGKMQKFLDENAALRRANAELETMRAQFEERARQGDEAKAEAQRQLEETASFRAEAERQRDAAAKAQQQADDRANVLEKRAAQLEAALDEARQRVAGAEQAMQNAGQAANKLADVSAAKDALEKEAERLGGKLADAEAALMRAQEEAEESKKSGGASENALAMMRDRIKQLEDALVEREAGEREAKETLVTMQGEIEQQRKTLTDHYEQRLRDAAAANPATAASDALQERDAYRQRLAETEAWVQQAQVHLEALRVERDQLAAQATALGNDVHARAAETQELYTQLATSKQQVEALTGRSAGLEQELVSARAQVQRAQQQLQAIQQQASQQNTAVGLDPQLLAAAQDEIKALRSQMQARPAMQTGPDQQAFRAAQDEIAALRGQLQQIQSGGGARLPEELEPLRWTLTAAIDAITALETREPSLAAHLRNLRLLASTLQKLAPSS